MTLPAIPRMNLSDGAAAAIRAEILSGRWPVGNAIPAEPELASQLGVSRGTLREALRSLQYAGLLEIRRGDGTYVRSRSEVGTALAHAQPSLRDVLEARATIEPQLARLAAERASAAQIAQIRAALEARNAADGTRWARADAAFHRAVAEAACSPVLEQVYLALLPLLEESTDLAAKRQGFRKDDPRGHQELLDAIERRDPRTAFESAQENLTATEAWSTTADAV
ncbi:FadR/GntR family transcriptional regulator [Leucobacter sp. GX0328]